MKRRVKLLLIAVIIPGTIILFVRYAMTHADVVHKLRSLSPGMFAALLVFYGLWFLSISVALAVSLKIYGKRISGQENVLLNAYSSLVNFFGPGQSGPAFRAVYLKKRHGFAIKHYVFTTLLYYGFYAVGSAFLLCVGSRPWWQTAALVIAVGLVSAYVIRRYGRRGGEHDENKTAISPILLGYLALAVGMQMIAQVGMYYVELRHVSPGVTFPQILTYTGAANFALFVSLTPGAIGIREAFLVFSQNLHHIGNSAIVAANIIDRAMYLVVLGLMFIGVLAMHAQKRLHITGGRPEV
ncbi:MAG TPA: lysylphosphatidylglycerol synthase domain-containing protein [Candidatus Saccharimonadales bacterium]